jgi:hypothetical protein
MKSAIQSANPRCRHRPTAEPRLSPQKRLDALLNSRQCLLERPSALIRILNGRRIRQTPVQSLGCAEPNGTLFRRGTIAKRDHNIQALLTVRGKLIPTLGSQVRSLIPGALENLVNARLTPALCAFITASAMRLRAELPVQRNNTFNVLACICSSASA